MLWFAGAGIAQHVFDEVQQLAVETCGERILFLTGFGSTETAPYALARTWHSNNAANVGLPAVGLDMKLVPTEGKLEGRVRGPSITPGYWRRPELTAAAFDDEGFYRLGDAFQMHDPGDISKGPVVRRTHGGKLQARHRHLGACRSAARASSSLTLRR